MSEQSQAGHIVGGEMYYDCLGNNSFKFTLKLYRDCLATGQNVAQSFDAQAAITIYRGQNLFDTIRVNLLRESNILPSLNSSCITPPNVCVKEGLYEFTLTLPTVPEGYTIVHQRCCRSASIVNLQTPSQFGGSFYVTLTEEALRVGNSSPRFSLFPPTVLCSSLLFSFDHSATDPNGNRLVYRFETPENGGGNITSTPGNSSPNGVIPFPATPPPYTDLVFVSPYTLGNPVGGNPPISIDSITGRVSGRPNTVGRFVVTVTVTEYDNQNRMLSVVRRDFQFNVVNCQVNVFAEINANGYVPGSQVFLLRQCSPDPTVSFINRSGQAANIRGYQWTFDMGNGSAQMSTDINPTVTFPGYGIYHAKLVVNPGNIGCTDSASVEIRLYPPLVADYSFITASGCRYDSVHFTDQSHAQGGAPVTGWDWDFNDGSTHNTIQNPAHLYSQAGNFQVKLTATDQNGCVDDTTHTVSFFPASRLNLVVPSTPLCDPATINFINNSTPINGYTVFWEFGDGSTSSDLSPTHTFNTGSYPVHLTLTSPTGCVSDTSLRALIVRESPVANFTYQPIHPTSFNRTVRFSEQCLRTFSWDWDFGGISQTTRRNPSYTFPDTGYIPVRLVATNASGCTDTITKIVDISPDYTFFLPNAFTPDDDGVNDLFIGNGFTHDMNGFDLSIWNRWGELVFQTNNPKEGWNGKKQGTTILCPAGVYVYALRVKGPRGKDMDTKGTVMLIR
jgi:gliding motility-associated-like protein